MLVAFDLAYSNKTEPIEPCHPGDSRQLNTRGWSSRTFFDNFKAVMRGETGSGPPHWILALYDMDDKHMRRIERLLGRAASVVFCGRQPVLTNVASPG